MQNTFVCDISLIEEWTQRFQHAVAECYEARQLSLTLNQ